MDDITYTFGHKKGMFAKREIIDLAKSALAIALAFTIASVGLSLDNGFITILVISVLTAGVGFLLHEIAHKLVAQRYNCTAFYKSDDRMLIITIFISFLGVIFAAPGAVYIFNRISTTKNGIISLAGPATNLALGALFFLLYLFANSTLMATIGFFGFSINAMLALFNMIPFGNFDGRKILAWNWLAYGIMVGTAVIMFVLREVIIQGKL